jgi:hypothetical protein
VSATRAAVVECLDAQPWAYETRAFACLDLTFSVRTTDPELGSLLDALYVACATDDPPQHRYAVRERASRPANRFVVYCDGERLVATPSASIALDHLVWDVNRRTIDATQQHLVLHASAAARDGCAAIFSAPSGAGKSTLVAGLVARGMRYVTDEAVAIDPTDGTVRSYPKPIALERGAWHLFDGDASIDASRYTTLTHYRSATRLGGVAETSPVVPRLVVVPRYVPRGAAEVRTITRAGALVRLADQSFNFDTFGAARLPLLARLLEGCTCYELDVHDLDDAAATVGELLDAAIAAAP